MNRAKLLRYLASCIVLQITRQSRPAIRHQNSFKLDFLFDSGFARDSLPILYMIEIQQVRYYMKPIKQTNKTIWVKKFKTKKFHFQLCFGRGGFQKWNWSRGEKVKDANKGSVDERTLSGDVLHSQSCGGFLSNSSPNTALPCPRCLTKSCCWDLIMWLWPMRIVTQNYLMIFVRHSSNDSWFLSLGITL